MKAKPLIWISAILFSLIAILHLVRLFTGFQVVIGVEIPLWASLAGFIIGGVLAILNWVAIWKADDLL